MSNLSEKTVAERLDHQSRRRASSAVSRIVMLFVVLIVVIAGFAVTLDDGMYREHASAYAHTDSAGTTIENLRAFAKLYGYVKYFHPSDAASNIDWDRFAVHGVQQVKNAASWEALRDSLEALFLPIAPTVQIFLTAEPAPNPDPLLTPDDRTGLQLVAWQHLGVGLGNPGPYRSIRLNRASGDVVKPSSASFWMRIDAVPYRGKEIQLTAAVKTGSIEAGIKTQLTLVTERANNEFGFMESRPVTSTEWKTYEISGTVADDANTIGLAGTVVGSGRAWFDDFQLLVRAEGEDQWTVVTLENAGFESDLVGEPPTSWDAVGPGYSLLTDNAESYKGERSLAIDYIGASQEVFSLFEQRPEAGEVVEKTLGGGLAAKIPLALYSRDEQTLRPEDAPSPKSIDVFLQGIAMDALTAEDEELRLANVLIAWNVMQHFYPYFDVVDVDWDAVLSEALHRASYDRSAEDFFNTLRWMMAQLDDGHGSIEHPDVKYEAGRFFRVDEAGLPFRVDEVEGHVVIVAVADEARGGTCFARGDVVVSFDDLPTDQILSELKQYISGSPQKKTFETRRWFGIGPRGTSVRLELDRAGEAVICMVVRDSRSWIRETLPDTIEELRDGVYYVDLRRAPINSIESEALSLSKASGVVFDLRGYPRGNHGVLQYLSPDTLLSTLWHIPQQIYPDQMNLVEYDTTAGGRWILPPREPHFSGKIVFLTDANAISYSESVLGIVEHYELGDIVGQRTAGVTGNANPFILPGGYRIVWTGMRVVKHDGSLHHNIGIQPTIPVERTLAGVRAGRDEILEKALEVIELSKPDDR